jgi:hypothetical protein
MHSEAPGSNLDVDVDSDSDLSSMSPVPPGKYWESTSSYDRDHE